MDKYIFLDFDGVLINRSSLRRHSGDKSEPDSACVAALNRITDETDAKIVVSSVWRKYNSNNILAILLLSWGVTGTMAGSTPIIYKSGGITSDPTSEIAAYLKRRPYDSFVILDDMSGIAFKSNLVQTDHEIGLTEELADRAISILKGEM